MQSVFPELVLLFALLFAGGIFAMAELAVAAARKARLRELAEAGDARAARALAVAEDPARFRSAVRGGFVCSLVCAGALGGGGLAAALAEAWREAPWAAGRGGADAWWALVVALVVVLLAVVLCELAPKRLARANPEGVARALAGPLDRLGGLVHPGVELLGRASETALRGLGLGKARAQEVSEGEVNDLVQQGLRTGAFNPTETEMVAGVLELDQLAVTEIMTPRPKMVFLNLDDPEEVNWRKIVTSGHSRYPVYATNRDQVVGVVTVKAIWANTAFGLPANLRHVMSPPLIVSEKLTVIHLIEQFRKTGQHLALVTDEFGAIQGLVTMIDVMEAIAGDLPEKGRRAAPEARKREDGSWLIDATLLVAEFKELLGVDVLPHEETAEFKTAGGFVMTYFGRIPRAGDHFDHAGWRFEVIDMDRHRIDKLLLTRLPGVEAGDDDAAADETRA
jgi:putative hemolysin